MSEKNLLNESQVRQFMKLARLTPLTQGFVEGLQEAKPTDPELEESHGRGRDEGAAGYGHPDANTRLEEEEGLEAQDHDLENADDDLDHAADLEVDAEEDIADLPPSEDAPGAQMISVQDLMDALTSALEEVTGQPVESEIEGDTAEVDADMDVELDTLDAADSMEADTEMEMDDGPLEEGGDKKGDQSDDDLDYEKNESAKATDELVEQVTKRVAARILKAALAKK